MLVNILAQHPVYYSVVLFLIGAGLIAFFGVKMTYLARDLAKLTGLGEAVVGAVLIGAMTSLSGIIASATAAWNGLATIAVSNSLGGIAAQTLFLVLADLAHRKINLEYAAASAENMMMASQLMLLLGILYFGFTLPSASLFGVHPASWVLIVTYLFTLKLLVDTHEKPMWLPRMGKGTVKADKTDLPRFKRIHRVNTIFGFAFCALVVGVSGWLLANTGMVITQRTGLSDGVVGGIFMAVSTSLPELIVAVTAVRMGALTLAVGDIIGGNAFDTLFIAISDFFYREGSIFMAITSQEYVWLGTAMLMNTVLLLGLMYRQRKGLANIGLESVAIFLIYCLTVAYLSLAP